MGTHNGVSKRKENKKRNSLIQPRNVMISTKDGSEIR